VWHYTDHISGFKFYNRQGEVVLEAGCFDYTMQEVPLQEGERLVGVRSKLYSNTAE
jgi:hypothetical protein